MNQTPPIKTIIYATDLGDHMLPVFRQAITLAEQFEARIVMLHVTEPLTSTGMAVVEAYLPKDDYERFQHEGMQKILEHMRQRISNFFQEETGSCPDDSALISDVVVTHGRPSNEIPHQAKERGADLIVMGTCSHCLWVRLF